MEVWQGNGKDAHVPSADYPGSCIVYRSEDRYCTVVVTIRSFTTGFFLHNIWKLSLIPKICYESFCVCTEAFGKTTYF